MSVTEPFAGAGFDLPGLSDDDLAATTVDRWADTVDRATEPCLVIDAKAVVAAASPAACRLLGFSGPQAAVGVCLHDGALPLIDFAAVANALPDTELAKIPPVQALLSHRLARGLLRVRLGTEVVTIDAVATPLLEGPDVVGSLTFFCTV
jgi:PAS domain-containing protein